MNKSLSKVRHIFRLVEVERVLLVGRVREGSNFTWTKKKKNKHKKNEAWWWDTRREVCAQKDNIAAADTNAT